MSNQLIADLDSLIRLILKDRQVGEITPLAPPKSVADDVIKRLVRDVHHRPVAVVHCSSPASAQLVARGARLCRQAKAELGDASARRVLEPIFEGDLNGLSYAVTPYCHPLSPGRLRWRVERRWLRDKLLNWVWNIAKITAKDVDPEARDRCFVHPLTHLIQLEGISDRVRVASDRALCRLNKKAWSPKLVLTHNDLWKGNVLIAAHGSGAKSGETYQSSWADRFVVIDWAGAVIRGHAFVDLVKLVDSFAVPDRRFRLELERHCQILDCDREDVSSYLLAGMGHLGMNLEYFQFDRYVTLVEKSLDAVTRVGIS